MSEEQVDNVESQEESVEPLGMSDEEFEASVLKDFETLTSEVKEDIEEETADEVTEDTVTEEENIDDTDKGVDIDESSEETSDINEDVSDEGEEEISAEQIRDELFKPFKANGREVQITSVEDARTLMQKGAGLEKKLSAIKPLRKISKKLENNDLLDEEKLDFLIDISKGDTEAIKKLLKDNNIDIDSIDTNSEIAYKRNNYTVNDKEVELDETLDNIKDTDSYSQTLNIISKEWDASSKQMLMDNPAAIEVLNNHVQQGIYSKIANAVETERMFGRIPSGMSDLEAYRKVGDEINARGGFSKSANSKSANQKPKSTVTKKVTDPKLSKKKKAASSTKSSSSNKPKTAFNPLGMSDEEFEKLSESTFM